jgi:mono/diheme cytochrome c family protein
LAAGFFLGMSAMSASAAMAQSGAVDADQSLIEHGKYLATAADCAACHTASNGGRPFAGGYAISSPLGTIYSSNITPSKTAGIGNYSEADFARALREGIRSDGSHLYPAMPYTSYSGLSDKDVAAMYAYFMHAVPAVDTKPKETALPFPFNIRASMAVWNALFLKNARAVPDANASEQLNRGAYLVNNLAHCAECHTPRNALMSIQDSLNLSGAPLGSWYAPNITSDPVSGIGSWTNAQIVQYLQTGNVPGLAQAAGPMAEAITNSLQYLSKPDLESIAAYLKATKPISTEASGTSAARNTFGSAHSADNVYRGIPANPSSGAQIFSGTCAACHRANGSGTDDGFYPKLFNNTATGAPHANNLIATILFGVDRTVDGKEKFMPGFGPHAYVNQLSYQEVAEVSNYVLKQYGNPSVTVTAQDVQTVAEGGRPSPLLKLGKLAMPALIVLLVIVVLLLLWFFLGRRPKTIR